MGSKRALAGCRPRRPGEQTARSGKEARPPPMIVAFVCEREHSGQRERRRSRMDEETQERDGESRRACPAALPTSRSATEAGGGEIGSATAADA